MKLVSENPLPLGQAEQGTRARGFIKNHNGVQHLIIHWRCRDVNSREDVNVAGNRSGVLLNLTLLRRIYGDGQRRRLLPKRYYRYGGGDQRLNFVKIWQGYGC